MAFETILIAVDGSANAQRALDAAIDLAKSQDARLLVLHAVIAGDVPRGLLEWARVEHLIEESGPQPVREGPAYGRLGVVPQREGGVVPHRARLGLGQAIVDDAAAQARKAGVGDVQTFVEDGDAAEVIEQALSSQQVDLVVLGTRGHGRLKGLLVGSVSHKVVGLHACPVLVVP